MLSPLLPNLLLRAKQPQISILDLICPFILLLLLPTKSLYISLPFPQFHQYFLVLIHFSSLSLYRHSKIFTTLIFIFMMLNEYSPFSFTHKLKSSIRCFRPDHGDLDETEDDSSPTTPRSPLKSMASELPELREMCRNLVARFSRSRRRYHHSADFRYDPSSYALNFEDEQIRDDDEFPIRDFTSRLPASPPAK